MSNDNLETLSLSKNDLSDVNILKNIDFKGLKQLFLDSYSLSDIKGLETCNFNK
jgi:Leucine-rich repeat (LRR) protein